MLVRGRGSSTLSSPGEQLSDVQVIYSWPETTHHGYLQVTIDGDGEMERQLARYLAGLQTTHSATRQRARADS